MRESYWVLGGLSGFLQPGSLPVGVISEKSAGLSCVGKCPALDRLSVCDSVGAAGAPELSDISTAATHGEISTPAVAGVAGVSAAGWDISCDVPWLAAARAASFCILLMPSGRLR